MFCLNKVIQKAKITQKVYDLCKQVLKMNIIIHFSLFLFGSMNIII